MFESLLDLAPVDEAVLDEDLAQHLRSLAVLQNVTEAKRVADELRQTHARLDAIVENVPAMLGYWDAERTTRFVNREMQAAIGLPTENIVGRPLRAEHVPPRGGEVKDSQADIAAAGKALGYEPHIELEEGLRRTVAWYKAAAKRD